MATLKKCLQSFICYLIASKINQLQTGEILTVFSQYLQSFIFYLIAEKVNCLQTQKLVIDLNHCFQSFSCNFIQ